MKKIEIEDSLKDFLEDASRKCNASIGEVINNLLIGAMACHAAKFDFYKDDKLAIIQELLTKNGKLFLKGEALFQAIFTSKKTELIELEIVRELMRKFQQISSKEGNA